MICAEGSKPYAAGHARRKSLVSYYLKLLSLHLIIIMMLQTRDHVVRWWNILYILICIVCYYSKYNFLYFEKFWEYDRNLVFSWFLFLIDDWFIIILNIWFWTINHYWNSYPWIRVNVSPFGFQNAFSKRVNRFHNLNI